MVKLHTCIALCLFFALAGAGAGYLIDGATGGRVGQLEFAVESANREIDRLGKALQESGRAVEEAKAGELRALQSAVAERRTIEQIAEVTRSITGTSSSITELARMALEAVQRIQKIIRDRK